MILTISGKYNFIALVTKNINTISVSLTPPQIALVIPLTIEKISKTIIPFIIPIIFVKN